MERSSSSFSLISHFPTLKRHLHDDAPSVGHPSLNASRPAIHQRSLVAIPPRVTLSKMQQANQSNLHEAGIGVPSRLCSVCGDISTGIHFGGNSCESCKAFFRRSVQCLRFQNYKCSSDERCPVNIVTRKVCQYCRYAKCTAIGMKPKWVLSDQEREEKYGARRKRFRENRATEEDPDIYKYLNKEEKLLVEDIAHALYQSRATYPLNFPSPSTLFSPPSSTPPAEASVQSPGGEKPPSASANLLIVPIQRLVLFARMLKDFDLFSEDDKVSLLKGSAIEIMVCSSSTLFNPKTHTFTNYLSRDQRAIMDEQIMPLDPLLTRLWGEDTFNRTRAYLISMCNLHVDEVTSTLLVPVILFSPDRLNIKDLELVQSLQVKYVTLLRKYMNWRYGLEQTELIYPKLLLQIVNIRSLSLAHGEVIQKLMATSSVNPLVQEVTVKQELMKKPPPDRMDSLSMTSSPFDGASMDFDNTPSNLTESNNGSDDDDYTRKKSRAFTDDDLFYDNDDIDESNPRNIWRKRRKVTNDDPIPPTMHVKATPIERHQLNTILDHHKDQRRDTTDASTLNTYPTSNQLHVNPYDYQTLKSPDSSRFMTNGASPMPSQFPRSPSNKSSFVASPQVIQQLQQLQQLHQAQAASNDDLTSYNVDSPSNLTLDSLMSPLSGPYFDGSTLDSPRQHYGQASTANYQQQRDNEQQLLLLSLANQSQASPSSGHATDQPPMPLTAAESSLDKDEQQLLDAIHAHPNKRDLVLNLLRQMNESTSLSPQSAHQQQTTMDNFQQEQRRSNLSTTFDPYQDHSNMDHDS